MTNDDELFVTVRIYVTAQTTSSGIELIHKLATGTKRRMDKQINLDEFNSASSEVGCTFHFHQTSPPRNPISTYIRAPVPLDEDGDNEFDNR